MPVVNLDKGRLQKFLPKIKLEKIMNTLPFIALDIEGVEDGVIRVEYNPNRPDFSSDYGIVRALKGLLDVETGVPRFKLAGKSKCTVKVGKSIRKIRPYISALVAKGGSLDDESIKQIIAMQEDLHNGIGRRRKKASIGIHNLDAIHFPIRYDMLDESFEFVPLGESSKFTLKKIIDHSETGMQYGHILKDSDGAYPIIVDNRGTVLSFPPIINGSITKIDAETKNLFVEVTATDKKAAEDILAIVAITLYDAGFQIQTVTIGDDSGHRSAETPHMNSREILVSNEHVNRLLGLQLTTGETIRCLKKSRIGAKRQGKTDRIICTIPKYRTDIFGTIDIVEETAIGYGIYNLEPSLPMSSTSGKRNLFSIHSDAIRETLSGMGLLGSVNFSLVSKEVQYGLLGRKPEGVLAVEGTKSAEHEVLRDSLIPSLLLSLSRNIHEEYPQKMFEIGKVFSKLEGIQEYWSVAVVSAHAQADYTEAKSILQGMLKLCFGKDVTTKARPGHPFFIEGRCASIFVDGKEVGSIGEIAPLAISNFKLRVPVSAFEINLSHLLSSDLGPNQPQ